MNWTLLLETYAVTALSIFAGWCVIYLISSIIGGAEYSREKKIRRKNEEHANRSMAENRERLELLGCIRNARPEEKPMLWEMMHDMEERHGRAWDARVKEIVDLEVPYDEDTMASVQRGENPYRRR
jgi:hypothetical protein